MKSAVLKEIRPSKVREANGKRQLKVVAGDQQESKMRGSVMSELRDEHTKNSGGCRRGNGDKFSKQLLL